MYFKAVVNAFKARFKQLGGKIVDAGDLHALGGDDDQQRVSRVERRAAAP